MKNVISFLLVLFLFAASPILPAQNVDIDKNSQFNLDSDSTYSSSTTDNNLPTDSYNSITETYQIPGYSLYDNVWDTEHLRKNNLTIPLVDNKITIILVQSNNNSFVYPCLGDVYLDYGIKKGKFHTGIDFKAAPDSPVRNCFDGVIRMAKYYGDYGNMVVVRHYNGLETVYAHLSSLKVRPGQIVQAGDIVGLVGHSGSTPIDILHFEIRFMNEFFNPSLVINFTTEELMGNTLILTQDDFSNTVATPAPNTATTKVPSARIPATTPDSTPDYHVIKAGETLYRVSVTYNIPIPKLLEINNLKESSTLSVGQKIKLK